MEQEKKIVREFKITTWALKNKNTVYLMGVMLMAFGYFSYLNLPKELFPEVFMPTVVVQTVYPGNAPIDMENLVTRPLEKEIESIRGINEMTSTSAQDVSVILCEFNMDTDINKALQDVKDAVDKAKSELPNDLLDDPIVDDIDFTEFPIININLSGEYSIVELKKYAEYLEDEMEGITEVSKVEITGVNDREVKVHVDPYEMEARNLSFGDIENAIAYENMSIAGGELRMNNTRRSVRILGEFEDASEIEDIIVKSENGNIVYLRDVATIEDGFEDPNNYARLNKQAVVSLQVVKKGGENLLETTDKIFQVLEEAQRYGLLPKDLTIDITNDQSDVVRKQLSNLENSIIMGVIFVIVVLFFFLGARNSLFVGLAIPTSMFVSFVVFSLMGTTINMIILFGLILALGMLVDNAIVVVENIYRFLDQGYSRFEAAKQAVGEIAMPIISSTATTLAAFFPLIFWDSIIGEFMKFLPITLIIVLSSSLFVALVIIPVISSSFIKQGEQTPLPKARPTWILIGILATFSVVSFFMGSNAMGNLFALFSVIGIMNYFFLSRAARWFQDRFLVWLEGFYIKVLSYVLSGKKPFMAIGATTFLLFVTIIFYFSSSPKVLFFPDSDPKFINILAELPIGTDLDKTDSLMHAMEDDVSRIIGKRAEIVKSVLTTVGTGAKGENDFFSFDETPHKGLITVSFLDYELRKDINTTHILKDLSDGLIGKYPGVQLSVEKNSEGPPTGKPINIEISGKEFDDLIFLADSVKAYIENSSIAGIEGLKVDMSLSKPEMIMHIDRDKARRFGLSTGQIASTIRTALFGKEVSDYKVGEDEFPIQLRMQDQYRYDVPALMNQKITFRDAATGKIHQIPISAVADISYGTTYNSVKRKDMDRVITVYSNVIEGYNATEVNNNIKNVMQYFEMPDGYRIDFTGEQEEQEESMAFLIRALLIAISLITIILVTQFNSVVKPAIILASVLFSTIGVFGGLATFQMEFVVVMTGIGIVSLAGVVVNNAIVLIDYIDLLKSRRRKELGMDEKSLLPADEALDCVVRAGKTRLRPVLLTAITTIMGLTPLAVGLNINLITALTDFDPQIYFGGDNAVFWGPISWTIIFGLSFATFLTLVIVPSMYHASWIMKTIFAKNILKTERK